MDLVTFVTETVIGFTAISVPIIVGLVGVLKGFITSARWYPVLSLAFGLAIGFLFGPSDLTSWNILGGVIAGLAASGLYSTVSTIKHG